MKKLKVFLIILVVVACSKKEDESEVVPDLRTEQEIIDQYLNIDLDVPLNYSNTNFPDHYTLPIIEVTNEPDSNLTTNLGAQLGRVLFYDVNLSRNNTISCSSCHQQNNAFSDLDQFSTGFEGGETGAHSMRLLNSLFYAAGTMFWDKRASTLEDQVIQPIQDHIEMGFDSINGGMGAVVNKLEQKEYYPILFKEAFGTEEISTLRIQKALAQFVRSMISVNSKFDDGFEQVFDIGLVDRGLTLNFPNFNPAENRGKNLFSTPKYPGAPTCAGCHRPPTFALALESRSNGLDAGETTTFKSPSLKSIAEDGAFMHDGRFSTLAEVIEHYSTGVELGPATDNLLIQNNGEPHRLNFTEQDVEYLVAFLETLTDNELANDVRFSDPFK